MRQSVSGGERSQHVITHPDDIVPLKAPRSQRVAAGDVALLRLIAIAGELGRAALEIPAAPHEFGALSAGPIHAVRKDRAGHAVHQTVWHFGVPTVVARADRTAEIIPTFIRSGPGAVSSGAKYRTSDRHVDV
jgi:hypothetical protein